MQALRSRRCWKPSGGETWGVGVVFVMMEIFVFLPSVLFGDFPVALRGQAETPVCFVASTVQALRRQSSCASSPRAWRDLSVLLQVPHVVFWAKTPRTGLSKPKAEAGRHI